MKRVNFVYFFPLQALLLSVLMNWHTCAVEHGTICEQQCYVARNNIRNQYIQWNIQKIKTVWITDRKKWPQSVMHCLHFYCKRSLRDKIELYIRRNNGSWTFNSFAFCPKHHRSKRLIGVDRFRQLYWISDFDRYVFFIRIYYVCSFVSFSLLFLFFLLREGKARQLFENVNQKRLFCAIKCDFRNKHSIIRILL